MKSFLFCLFIDCKCTEILKINHIAIIMLWITIMADCLFVAITFIYWKKIVTFVVSIEVQTWKTAVNVTNVFLMYLVCYLWNCKITVILKICS